LYSVFDKLSDAEQKRMTIDRMTATTRENNAVLRNLILKNLPTAV
jgi:hypothetical protein